MPSAADVACTQNAGHGLVIGTQEGCLPGALPLRSAEGPGRLHGPEFRALGTGSNISWHDSRLQLGRKGAVPAEPAGAHAMKQQDLSSEVFGESTASIWAQHRCEVMAQNDQVPERLCHDPPRSARSDGYPQNSHERFAKNSASSGISSLNPEPTRWSAQGTSARAAAFGDADTPGNAQRRRQEKNFSDLFGSQMGERHLSTGGREDAGAFTAASVLDSRVEIAARNKVHHHDDLGPDVPDSKVRPGSSHQCRSRKEAELTSHMFDKDRTHTLRARGTGLVQSEHACWDTRGVIQASSEVARHQAHLPDDVNDYDRPAATRKQTSLSSAQARRDLGATPAYSSGSSRAAGSMTPIGQMTPSGTRLDFNQSNIFWG